MAWRISDCVVRGEIDNQKPGEVTGTLWLLGRDEPMHLRLEGNCHRDLAGCKLSFENPDPTFDQRVGNFDQVQHGQVGDMTAARKVKVPVSEDALAELSVNGLPPPTRMANAVYLEWYSEANGRVVVESTDYNLRVSEPAWTITPEQERQQLKDNQKTMADFLDRVAPVPDRSRPTDWDAEKPLDEFEAEKLLKESDDLADRHLELLDKYRDHPDRERLIAEAMGWSIDMTEAELEEFEIDELEENESDGSEWSSEEANEDTESDDEIEFTYFDEHPLCHQTQDLAIRMTEEADTRGVTGSEDPKDPIHQMVYSTMTTGAKLAGALATSDDDDCFEPGMTVAWLKRALNYLHEALAGADSALKQYPQHKDWITAVRTELFQIRTQVLDLMKEYRQKLG